MAADAFVRPHSIGNGAPTDECVRGYCTVSPKDALWLNVPDVAVTVSV